MKWHYIIILFIRELSQIKCGAINRIFLMFSISNNIMPKLHDIMVITHSTFEYKKDHFILSIALDKSIRFVRIVSDPVLSKDMDYFVEKSKVGTEYLVLTQEKKSIIKI